jgi:integrase
MSRSGQNTTTSYLEWNEFTSLIHRLERDGEFKFALLIALGTFTGLRISDLLTLRYSDFGNGDILKLKEGKTGKERSIKINKDLREIIERIKNKFAIEDTSQLIFLNKYGKKAIDK